MGSRKTRKEKKKLAKLGKIKRAPRWVDIKKFGLKRARGRMVRVNKTKHWRRSKHKI